MVLVAVFDFCTGALCVCVEGVGVNRINEGYSRECGISGSKQKQADMTVHTTSQDGCNRTGVCLEFVEKNVERLKIRFTVDSSEHFVLKVSVFDVEVRVLIVVTMKESLSYVTQYNNYLIGVAQKIYDQAREDGRSTEKSEPWTVGIHWLHAE